MIVKGSRYENQPVILALDGKGMQHPTVYGSPAARGGLYYHYQVLGGDRLDIISAHFYQRADLWWKIADANPEIFYPDQLVPGSIIRVPVK